MTDKIDLTNVPAEKLAALLDAADDLRKHIDHNAERKQPDPPLPPCFEAGEWGEEPVPCGWFQCEGGYISRWGSDVTDVTDDTIEMTRPLTPKLPDDVIELKGRHYRASKALSFDVPSDDEWFVSFDGKQICMPMTHQMEAGHEICRLIVAVEEVRRGTCDGKCKPANICDFHRPDCPYNKWFPVRQQGSSANKNVRPDWTNGVHCEHCGAWCIDNCLRCGAPQCCPQCCSISELESQIEQKNSEIDMLNRRVSRWQNSFTSIEQAISDRRSECFENDKLDHEEVISQ